MPQNQRESLLYTVMMCFVMVLWMSIYNVALQYGTLDLEVLEKGGLASPLPMCSACAVIGLWHPKLPRAWRLGICSSRRILP